MDITAFTSLKSHFLIAMPKMADQSFASSLTVICEHSRQGALGIIVNRPTSLKLEEIFRQVGIAQPETCCQHSDMVYSGGPVAVERGFVLNSGEMQWESSLAICEGLQLTTSKDILVAISEQKGPTDSMVALGYAGWGAGQLEAEIASNVWLNCEADPSIIFKTPNHMRLSQAAATMGVDLTLISDQVGHA